MPGAVPFHDLLRGFLQAAQAEGMETVVWAAPRGVIGQQHETIASNHSEAPTKARARLLVQDGAIENVAKAIHGFRFVEEGKTAVDPTMDFCAFLLCAGSRAADDEGNVVSVGAVPWEKLPETIKELHRTLAKVVLATLAQEPPKQEKSKIVVPAS